MQRNPEAQGRAEKSQDQQSTSSILLLPFELLAQIILFLDIPDIVGLPLVNRQFNQFFKYEYLYKEILRREYFGYFFDPKLQETNEKLNKEHDDAVQIQKIDYLKMQLRSIHLANQENDRRLDLFIDSYCNSIVFTSNPEEENNPRLRELLKENMKKFFYGQIQEEFFISYPNFSHCFLECINHSVLEYIYHTVHDMQYADLPFFRQYQKPIRLILQHVKSLNDTSSDLYVIGTMLGGEKEKKSKTIKQKIDSFSQQQQSEYESSLTYLSILIIAIGTHEDFKEFLEIAKVSNENREQGKKIDFNIVLINSLKYAILNGNLLIAHYILEKKMRDHMKELEPRLFHTGFKICDNLLSLEACKIFSNYFKSNEVVRTTFFKGVFTTILINVDKEYSISYLESVLPFLINLYKSTSDVNEFLGEIGNNFFNYTYRYLTFHAFSLENEEVKEEIERIGYILKFLIENGYNVNNLYDTEKTNLDQFLKKFLNFIYGQIDLDEHSANDDGTDYDKSQFEAIISLLKQIMPPTDYRETKIEWLRNSLSQEIEIGNEIAQELMISKKILKKLKHNSEEEDEQKLPNKIDKLRTSTTSTYSTRLGDTDEQQKIECKKLKLLIQIEKNKNEKMNAALREQNKLIQEIKKQVNEETRPSKKYKPNPRNEDDRDNSAQPIHQSEQIYQPLAPTIFSHANQSNPATQFQISQGDLTSDSYLPEKRKKSSEEDSEPDNTPPPKKHKPNPKNEDEKKPDEGDKMNKRNKKN